MSSPPSPKMLVVDFELGCLDVTRPSRAIQRAKMRAAVNATRARDGFPPLTGARLSATPGADRDPSPLDAPTTPLAPSPGRSVAAPAVRPSVPLPEPGSPATQWESWVKSTKGETLFEFARINQIQFDPQAPNPGVKVMRCRNAIYAWLRRGGVPKSP